MIKINFDETFTPDYVSEDLTYYVFQSELKDGEVIDVHVEFSVHPDPLLPDVYNLAFGPKDENDEINDGAKLNHTDTNKVFSTIVLFALTLLHENKFMSIGIDGSNDARAYLYHRMFISNKEEFTEYFTTIGVDWYVRLLRNGSIETDAEGMPYFKPRPEPFNSDRSTKDLYRYYILALNQQ